MFVRDCMTHHPITIRPESDPLAAISLLKAGQIRHLPVLDSDGKLVGIVDRADLERFLSTAKSPGVVRRQHRVDQFMTRDVVSVRPDCPLEEAATLMLEHKIGSLPVVENEQLVGIVTETDIFRQFATILGGGTGSLRLVVQVIDRPGQLAELAGQIAQADGNISSVVAYPSGQPGRINFVLRFEGAEAEVVAAIESLPELDVLHVWPGTS